MKRRKFVPAPTGLGELEYDGKEGEMRSTKDTKYSFRNALRALLERSMLLTNFLVGGHNGAAFSRWHIERVDQFRRASDAKKRWGKHERRWAR